MKNLICLLLIGSASLTAGYAQKNATVSLAKRQHVYRTAVAISARKPPATIPVSLTTATGTDQPAPAAPPINPLPEMPAPVAQTIRSYPVELAFNKTVSIIFPAPVRSVDLGSRDIIADKATDVENVLKVKANQIGFNETNFSVITADGKFYSFVVSYNESPVALALNLATTDQPLLQTRSKSGQAAAGKGSDAANGSVRFANVAASQSELVLTSDRILHKGRQARHVGAEGNKMAVTLKGVYVQDNVLYYRLAFQNRSNLNYDLDYVRFFIADKAGAKEASRQEIEVKPIYVHNDPIRTVKGHSQIEKVYAFQRFTLPTDKLLQIQTGEQNGGRQLVFSINNRVIMKAKPL